MLRRLDESANHASRISSDPTSNRFQADWPAATDDCLWASRGRKTKEAPYPVPPSFGHAHNARPVTAADWSGIFVKICNA